jgi:signal peptidase I
MKWKPRLNPWVLGGLGLFVVLVFFVLVLNLCLVALGFRAYTIKSAAMAPTLRSGEHILVNVRAFVNASPQRGDVVTFVRPNVGEFVFAKRVIAAGGDVIEGEGDIVKLNGPFCTSRISRRSMRRCRHRPLLGLLQFLLASFS